MSVVKTTSVRLEYTLFFYENILYKNVTRKKSPPKFKNKLRTYSRLRGGEENSL